MNIFPYLVGSVMTLVTVLAIWWAIRSTKSSMSVMHSQSYSYNVIKPFIYARSEEKIFKTQATDYEKKQHIPVILTDNQAYWILNNTLFTADQIDGMIDNETTRPVDTMSMDSVQLNKTIFIVESLTEGVEDDSWNSGN